ncbi:hypothetical protein HB779_17325 [Phyllobacterium sp. 628]|uniref:hypothetical protein n=1 Tax=Phyllobacterium sp. 628 TaxID=2718938 RepID=UPI001662449A|nr:hypothetical protein [Phyllobacterium sp. 628]QND53452.1 hypothetical protein HB779_17325 [Phyllobacterium sp. 628]
MTSVIIRIVLRYIAGYLALKSVLPQDIVDLIANDPDIAAAVGFGLMGVAEGAYALARRFGWSK